MLRSLAFLSIMVVGCKQSAEETKEPAPEEKKVVEEPKPEKSSVSDHDVHWSYTGSGAPQYWAELDKKFESCGVGKLQTPIDLPEKPGGKTPGALTFDYQPIPLAISNNGHTVQVENTVPGGMVVDGQRYYLRQMHLHSPSEHTVAGKPADMELHLVHRNAQDQLAVVGILLDMGKENESLKPIWDYLPTEISDKSSVVDGSTIDVRSLISEKAGYWTYEGSLTTPPCSEGVRWFILTERAQVSELQVKRFQELFHGITNRPVQPLNDRVVAMFKP